MVLGALSVSNVRTSSGFFVGVIVEASGMTLSMVGR